MKQETYRFHNIINQFFIFCIIQEITFGNKILHLLFIFKVDQDFQH